MNNNNIYRFTYKFVVLLLFLFISTAISSNNKTRDHCAELITKGKEKINNKNYSKALEFLMEAKVSAENNGWDEQLFSAINGIGVIHSELLNYGEALKYFLEAYQISLKDKKSRHNEMTSMINIAIMYFKEGNSDKAIEYLQKTYEISQINNDTILIGTSATNIAIIYNKTGKISQAKKYLDIGHQMFKDHQHELTYTKVAEIDNAFLSKNYEKAKQLIIDIIPEIQEEKNKEHQISVYLLLSKIYTEEVDTKKAISYIELALKSTPDIKNKVELYDQLSNIFLKDGKYLNAFAYKDSVLWAKDSLNKVTNSLHFENTRIKFERDNFQKDLDYSKERIAKERIVFFLIIVMAIILIWAIYNNATKQNQKKILAERNQKIIALELEQERSNKLLLEKQLKEKETLALLEQKRFDREQDSLKSQIEAKNRELVTKAMRLSSKNELINDIYNSVKGLPEVSKKKDLLNYMEQLKGQVKNESNQGNFLVYFEEVNQDFIHSLKTRHSNLSPNDIRFLSYIYIGLNTKEISSLLNITPDSCKKRKMRICQKLDLSMDASALYGYLSSL